MAKLLVAIVAASLPCMEATEFLGAQRQGESVAKDVVQQMFLDGLTSSENVDRLAGLMEDLRPTFAALPKNEHGHLEPTTVRYALHRHFVQKYGWYVKGLDPEGKGWNSSVLKAPSGDIKKASAPAYIQLLFATRSQSDGLDLGGLAVSAATLEDLIVQDGMGGLRAVYAKLKLPTEQAVSASSFEQAVQAYLAHLITGDYGKFDSAADIPALEAQAKEFYPEYNDIMKWFRNLYLSRNPFVMTEGVAFDRAGDYLREILRHFGRNPGAECQGLKKDLLKMEQPGTGRVLLSDFYGNKKLQMQESLDYLRNLGVVEHSDGALRLIIPNYVSSPSRCMPFSSYFSVCCPNECDGLMASLERSVGQPSVSPARVADVVSALPSDTVGAPRTLSSSLIARLNEIASLHGGSVPLHGRLFMQWMHHVYPGECPFPHVSGTVNPVTQDEWLRMHPNIEDAMATPQQRAKLAIALHPASPPHLQDIPWSVAEELVAEDKAGPGHTGEFLRIVVCSTTLLLIALRLLRVHRAIWSLFRRPKGRPETSEMLAI